MSQINDACLSITLLSSNDTVTTVTATTQATSMNVPQTVPIEEQNASGIIAGVVVG